MKAREARVLLTGATGGIGRHVAARLVDAGASVLLAGRSPAQLAALARDLGGAGRERCDWHEVDLLAPVSIETLAGAAIPWRCNVVVHAAGAPAFGAVSSLAPPTVQRVMATNLVAPMLLTEALLPHLGRQPRSQVLFVGSVLGAIGLPGHAAYCASKFGLRGYAQALRRELDGGPVRVQYLGPRSTRTSFNEAAVEAYNRATGTAMDDPARVAMALLRQLEDEASERFLGFPERLGVRLNGAVPGLLDRIFAPHRRALAQARADEVQQGGTP
ncbi:SDR family oxidoreductase [Ramlibacter sp. AW1]|uniref:SDR family oxidoreductase n=1 Tax=Ramlibacter aurantiacus TaxID=2801330 RepID=A0A937D4C2_9BURK|nr:SDR family oxidoreductase [Ramlibacter aurantiacus]MBL0418748.1 SDR family oxidoreductase [Ramlibacter aurantiacus]